MKKRFGFAIVFFLSISICMASFSDLASTHWAYDSVMYLTELGIISGMPDGTFKGNEPMTRYQSAVAMKRILDYTNSQNGMNNQLPSNLHQRLTELESLVNRSLNAVQRAGDDYREIMERLEINSTVHQDATLDYDELERVVGEILEVKLDSKKIEGDIASNSNEIQQLKNETGQIISELNLSVLERNETINRITDLESTISTYRWISISSAIIALGSIIMAGYVLLK